jgi:hypothetical protein
MEIDTTAREHQESGLNVTEDDLLEAKEIASNYTLEEVREVRLTIQCLRATLPSDADLGSSCYRS